MILESIHGAEDVKRLSLSEQKALAKELRRFISSAPCIDSNIMKNLLTLSFL